MLKYRLLHGPITEILAGAGHHAKVLIADGNYPASTARGLDAEVISLALSPGIGQLHAGARSFGVGDSDRGGQHNGL